jgi:hypothetical protein
LFANETTEGSAQVAWTISFHALGVALCRKSGQSRFTSS